jgi:Na+/melibiose symporter-like transporter
VRFWLNRLFLADLIPIPRLILRTTLHRQLTSAQYTLHGLGFTTRVITEVLVTVLFIYAQAITGYLSDRCRSKWGARKPFIAVGLLIIAASAVFLAIGVEFSGKSQSAFYLLFSCTSSVGEAMFATCITSWIFEVTSGQDEMIRTVNYYQYPAVVIGGIIMLPFSFMNGLRIAGVLLAALWTTITTYLFFPRCKQGDDRVIKRQDAILDTSIKILSNPLARSILGLFLIQASIAGFMFLSFMSTLNYDVLKTLTDSSIFLLMYSIVFAVLLAFLLNYFFTTKVNSKQWDPMKKMADWNLYNMGLFCIQLVITSTVNYKNYSLSGFVLYVILSVIIACHGYLMRLDLTVLLRKGCMSDLLVRGVDSFSQFNAAMLTATYLLNALVNAVVFSIFQYIGYHQNDDDSLDDKISVRYDVTSTAIWYMVIVNSLPCAILSYIGYVIAKRARLIYSKINNDKFEEEAKQILLAESTNEEQNVVELQPQAKSPLHASDEEGIRPLSKRTLDLNSAFMQLTNNELASLTYPDVSKRDSYKGFVKWIHVLTWLSSIMAAIVSLFYVGIGTARGLQGISLVVLLFVINSAIGFYETLKHEPLTTSLRLSGHQNFEEIVKDVIKSRNELRNAIKKIYELDEEGGNQVDGQTHTHMTRDKIIKSLVLLFCLLSFVVLVIICILYI